VRGPAALASDLTPLFRVHGGKAALAVAAVAVLLTFVLVLVLALASPAPFSAGFLGFLFIELVRSTPFVRRPATLASDLTPLFRVHGGKAALAVAAVAVLLTLILVLCVALAGPGPFPTGFLGFLFIELVGGTPFVRRSAALAGDLTPFLFIHAGEATAALGMFGSLASVLVGGFAMPAALLLVAGVVVPGRLTMVVGSGLVRESRVAVVGRSATFAADFCHVLAVSANRLTSLPTGLGGLFLVELVGSAALMGGPPAFAGDLALLPGVHRCEPTLGPGHHHAPFSTNKNTGRERPAGKRRSRPTLIN